MRNQAKHDEWRSIVGEWGTSGQTQKTYCASRGIAYSTFCYWSKKLKGERAGEGDRVVRAVEVGCIVPGRIAGRSWPTVGIDLDTQGIMISIPGCDATVTIAGRLSIDIVGRIMAACAVDSDHAQA